MKRSLILLLILLLLLTACTAKEGKFVYALIYDGICYVSGGQPIPTEPAPEAYVAYISSAVPAEKMPTEELQANFPSVGEPIAICDGKLHTLINNEWAAFEPAKE